MSQTRVGFAMCGSFCTFHKVLPEMENLVKEGYDVLPIMSATAYSTDTRFGKAADFVRQIEDMTGHEIIHTIFAAEPIGPKKLLDILVIAPATGNTLAKLANGVTDTPVTLACKAHLRNERPVLLAVSTNDGLGASGENIARLMQRKGYYFVPFAQDDPAAKPQSLKADMALVPDTLAAAVQGRQLQPVLLQRPLSPA